MCLESNLLFEAIHGSIRVGLSSYTLLMLTAASCLWAQSLPLNNASEKLVRSAGIIFSGAVVRIERGPDKDGKPASIRIALRVKQALRGCNAGETIEIAEWAKNYGSATIAPATAVTASDGSAASR